MNILESNPKARRSIALGSGSLALGLMLTLFVHPAGHTAQSAVHALSGFLMGIAIAANLMGLIAARRCRQTGA